MYSFSFCQKVSTYSNNFKIVFFCSFSTVENYVKSGPNLPGAPFSKEKFYLNVLSMYHPTQWPTTVFPRVSILPPTHFCEFMIYMETSLTCRFFFSFARLPGRSAVISELLDCMLTLKIEVIS